jgi:hypothetical protein
VRHLTAVLEDCERHRIRLVAKEDRLEVRGNLTPELREELSHRKPNILTYLRMGRCIHELEPDVCKVCNGYVRRLIESHKESAS